MILWKSTKPKRKHFRRRLRTKLPDQSEGELIEPETAVEDGEAPASAATDDAADANVEGVEAAIKE